MSRFIFYSIHALIFFVLFSVSESTANPNTAKIWYFGNQAGIDFSNGAPTPLNNGAMRSYGNVSTVSDENGQLLFYSNGGSFPYAGGVWNRNHQLMPNGMLNGMLDGQGGCNSAFQGVLTVRKPASQSQYYMFTTDCVEANYAGGLRYSVIDMNLDGGLGDVTQKYVPLLDYVSEGITAVQHANGEDYWIIAHKNNTDTFFVYQLTKNGITGVVKNKIGPVNPHHAGAIRPSYNGQKLFHGGLYYGALYDFDNSTGIMSNHIDLGIKAYDAAFSADCRYMYVTGSTMPSQLPKQLFQFDMHHHDIPSTRVQIGATPQLAFGNIQLGPDERIYISKFTNAPSLAVIKYPNQPAGEVDFQHNGLHLGGKNTMGGLPNFPNNVLGECAPYIYENSHHYLTTYTNEPFLKVNRQYQDKLNVKVNTDFQLDEVSLLVRKTGTNNWRKIEGFGNFIQIDGLDADTEYEIVIASYVREGAVYKKLFDFGSISKEQTAVRGRTLNAFSFNIFPNPTHGRTNIEFIANGIAGNLDLRIYDTSGKLVKLIQRNHVEVDFEQINLDLSDVQNGVYFVQIRADKFSHTERLVILQ